MKDCAIFCTLLISSIVLTIIGVANAQSETEAECVMESGSGVDAVSGTIRLRQAAAGGVVTLTLNLTGVTQNPNKKHGFHVHTGQSIGNKCQDAAGHFNVEDTTHGAPNDTHENRHTGDLGNVDVDANGNVNVELTDQLISLSGPTSVIGRAIVLHADEDDLGRGGFPDSNMTGHAGARLGCCLIRPVGSGNEAQALASFTMVAIFSCFVLMFTRFI